MEFLQESQIAEWEKLPVLHRLPRPGDAVWIRRQRWRVQQAWRDRHTVRIDVASRRRRTTYLAPFDAIADVRLKQRRARPQRARAIVAATLARSADIRLPLALLDARADILPHQIEPALAVIAGCTRMLIADDVGLGKTIQAGLVVAEILRREAAPRVLIIVPGSLRDQWIDELRVRFGIECCHGDRRGLDSLARVGPFGANPWMRSGVWMTSPDFLKQPHVAAALPLAPWDLVVIDEAHGMCGDSDRFAACDAVGRRSRRVLLLTATPHSGDAARYSRLLELGQLGNETAPLVFRRTRKDLGLRTQRHVRWHRVGLSSAESKVLSEVAPFEQVVLRAAGARFADGAMLLLAVFRKRALSTFAALSRSLSRRLAVLGDDSDNRAIAWVQSRLVFEDGESDEDQEELQALDIRTGLDVRHERAWLRRLRQLANAAARSESKVARLLELIRRTREPVVVFSEFRDSLAVVHERLRGLRTISLLHGRQDPSEQRTELREYLAGRSTVLLATDVAGQGLNLHTRGRWVISLELPWNPVRLEQRVGRVDRLGQTRPVHFTILVARDPAEQGLLEQLSRKTLIASTATSSPSTRWKRTAQTVARALHHRRQLAIKWRGPFDPAAAVLCTRGPGSFDFYFCSVPVYNGHGETIEHHSLAFSVPRALRGLEGLSAHLTQRAHVLIRRRLLKASRQISRTANALANRELDIARRIREDGLREGQPELFSAKALRTLESSEQASLSGAAAAESHAQDLLRSSEVRPGDVEVIAILPGRR